MKSAICGRCKQLVEIRDRRWSAHQNQAGEPCPISNSIYCAPQIHRSSGGGAPRIEFMGVTKASCPACHNHDVPALEFKVTGQKAGLN